MLHRLSVLLLWTNLALTLSSANIISVLAALIHGTPKIILFKLTAGAATKKVTFVLPNSLEFSVLILRFIINNLIVITPRIASLTSPVLDSMFRVAPVFLISLLLKPKSFKQLKLINDAWAPVYNFLDFPHVKNICGHSQQFVSVYIFCTSIVM